MNVSSSEFIFFILYCAYLFKIKNGSISIKFKLVFDTEKNMLYYDGIIELFILNNTKLTNTMVYKLTFKCIYILGNK